MSRRERVIEVDFESLMLMLTGQLKLDWPHSARVVGAWVDHDRAVVNLRLYSERFESIGPGCQAPREDFQPEINGHFPDCRHCWHPTGERPDPLGMTPVVCCHCGSACRLREWRRLECGPHLPAKAIRDSGAFYRLKDEGFATWDEVFAVGASSIRKARGVGVVAFEAIVNALAGQGYDIGTWLLRPPRSLADVRQRSGTREEVP